MAIGHDAAGQLPGKALGWFCVSLIAGLTMQFAVSLPSDDGNVRLLTFLIVFMFAELGGGGVFAVGTAAVFGFEFGAGGHLSGIVVLIGSALLFSVTLVFLVPAKSRWQGVFFAVFVLLMVIVCLILASVLSPFDTWATVGPLLLLLVLLTLINAPFNWASLGLTRALLRRGLELGGWYPYALALVDAFLAAGIIALLALTMVIGVQAFDKLAEHGGGTDARILPLKEFFDGIAANPGAPEYWWAYALLFSTMIPSMVNLMIGGASFIRGVPRLPALLLRAMPFGREVPRSERQWLALVLTSQVFLGAFLGIAAQVFLFVVVIFHIMPWFGLGLLDMARDLAEFDLPGRVLSLFWGTGG